MEKEILELEGPSSLEIFYDEIYSKVGAPSFYGHNLHALYDTLGSGACLKNIKIIWKDHQRSRQAIGEEEFDRIIKLLKQIQEEIEPTFELELR